MSTVERQQVAAGPRLDPPSPGVPRRRWLPRNATLVMAGAGALFFLVALLLVREGPAHRVLAATGDITAGTRISAGMFEAVEVRATPEVISGLVPAGEPVDGQVVANSLRAGELLAAGDLRPAGGGDHPLAMALPVAPERAVGGRLGVGDRVDVLEVVGGRARWVARDLQVVAVGTSDALGRGWQVTVAVDEATAQRLAEALAGGEVTVLRSTGAARDGEAAGAGR